MSAVGFLRASAAAIALLNCFLGGEHNGTKETTRSAAPAVTSLVARFIVLFHLVHHSDDFTS